MYNILKYQDADFDQKLQKITSEVSLFDKDIALTVTSIIDDVVKNKDQAVFNYTKKFDNVELDQSSIRVSEEEFQLGLAKCSDNIIEALHVSYARVREYHVRQLPINEKFVDEAGVTLGWKWQPISSVGLYVPGGKAFYPSSVIMNALPAIVAGVNRIAIAVPTPNGEINPTLLAAAKICGIDEIYKIGGAQAIAALAYGTESVKPVDKIVGPGNAYVAEAKRQVFGKVGIDMIAGPSEILVIADNDVDPRWIAADLLSQAEHDEKARSILITDDEKFARNVCRETEILIEMIGKTDIAAKSIKDNGHIIIVDSLEREATKIANIIAPEHLEICTKNPENISKRINNAGAIFLGNYTPEAVGDYIAGPSHVLPTSGSARFFSGLGVLDFMKRTSMVKSSKDALELLAEPIISLANEERLDAHALSVSLRIQQEEIK
jgi:histidinol dehydrogenase